MKERSGYLEVLGRKLLVLVYDLCATERVKIHDNHVAPLLTDTMRNYHVTVFVGSVTPVQLCCSH